MLGYWKFGNNPLNSLFSYPPKIKREGNRLIKRQLIHYIEYFKCGLHEHTSLNPDYMIILYCYMIASSSTVSIRSNLQGWTNALCYSRKLTIDLYTHLSEQEHTLDVQPGNVMGGVSLRNLTLEEP